MSIHAVAARAGVSTATVSRVLNDTGQVKGRTEDAVRRAIAELRYAPNLAARSLRSGRSDMLALVVPCIDVNFPAKFTGAFEEFAAQRGFDTLILSAQRRDSELLCCLHRLAERNINGFAILATQLPEAARAFLASSGIPAVLINGHGCDNDVRASVDSRMSSRDAAKAAVLALQKPIRLIDPSASGWPCMLIAGIS